MLHSGTLPPFTMLLEYNKPLVLKKRTRMKHTKKKVKVFKKVALSR